MNLVELGLFATVFAAFVYYQFRFYARQESPEAFRARFEAAFRALSVDAADPKFSFRGAHATIIDNKEFRLNQHNHAIISIERYARNEAGEYFFFVFEGKVPFFFKHVPHNTAKAALKEKYILADG